MCRDSNYSGVEAPVGKVDDSARQGTCLLNLDGTPDYYGNDKGMNQKSRAKITMQQREDFAELANE